MTSILILTPVLNRPQNAAPLLDSIRAASRYVELAPLFLASPGDGAELAELGRLGADVFVVGWEPGHGDYAKKMNAGWRRNEELLHHEFVFLGADDLRYQPGWAERALAKHIETGACVVGTNDLGNSRVVAGLHSTHTLVRHDYIECGTADDPDGRAPLCELYGHAFCDDEFIGTAVARETFAHATDALVEHAHPDWRKGTRDATYEKGQATFDADRVLRDARKHLWGQ